MHTTTAQPAAAFELRFESLFDAGRAFAFPCDARGRVQVEADARAEAAGFPGVAHRGHQFVKKRKTTGARFGELEECTEDPFPQSSKNWRCYEGKSLIWQGIGPKSRITSAYL